MFQVRTVVHYVHSSPVNGTHVTGVIKNSLTQNVKKKKKKKVHYPTNSTLSYTGNLFNI